MLPSNWKNDVCEGLLQDHRVVAAVVANVRRHNERRVQNQVNNHKNNYEPSECASDFVGQDPGGHLRDVVEEPKKGEWRIESVRYRIKFNLEEEELQKQDNGRDPLEVLRQRHPKARLEIIVCKKIVYHKLEIIKILQMAVF